MQKFAIIDLGSNSVRLVLYRQDEAGSIQEMDNVKSVLRLSSHFNTNGEINGEGIKKTIECLKRYKKLCEVRGIQRILGVATAAIRSAANGEQLLTGIYAETGIAFRILSGEQEAFYGYLAVVNSLDVKEAVTVDMGGGSTEITYFKNRSIQKFVSFPFGAVTLTQKFLATDPPAKEDLDRLLHFLDYQLSSESWLQGLGCPVIVMGGTARNLARMHQRKIMYSMSSVHNYRMEQSDIEGLLRWLWGMPIAERKEVDGLSKDRADIILSGLIAFLSVMKAVRSNTLITSNKGLRDGILCELLVGEEACVLPDVLEYGRQQFAVRYRVDLAHSEHVAELAGQLFDELMRCGLHGWGQRERTLLKTAASLFDIGRSINIIEASKHTFYLLENVLLLGATHRERLLIGLMASYKSNKQLRSMAAQHEDLLSKEDVKMAQLLGAIVMLARTMDRPMNQQLTKVAAAMAKNTVQLTLTGVTKDDWVYGVIKDQLNKMTKAFHVSFQLK